MSNKSKIFLSIVGVAILCELIIIINGYKLSVNVSESLPYRFFLIKTRNYDSIKNGDFIQFINKDAKYYNGKKITKQVLASSGDVVKINIFKQAENNIQGSITYNNTVLKVKDKTILGTKVYINDIEVIPENNYFVIGYNKNSFDSRYKEFGFINKDEVIGVAIPIF